VSEFRSRFVGRFAGRNGRGGRCERTLHYEDDEDEDDEDKDGDAEVKF